MTDISKTLLLEFKNSLESKYKTMSSLAFQMKNNIEYVDQILLHIRQYSSNELAHTIQGIQARRDLWNRLDENVMYLLRNLDVEIKSMPVLMNSTSSPAPNNSALMNLATNLAAINNSQINSPENSKYIIRIWDAAGAAFKTIAITSVFTVKDTLIAAFKKFKLPEADVDKYVLAESSITGDKIFEMTDSMLPISSNIDEFNEKEKDEYNHKRIVLRKSARKGVIRVYLRDNVLFKTFEVNETTTTDKLVAMAIQKFGLQGTPDNFEIIEIFNDAQKTLKPDDIPYILKLDWEKKHLDNLVRYTLRETMHGEILASTQEVLEILGENKSNSSCCDCGEREPSFISINLGITLCLRCASSHVKYHGSLRPNAFVSKIRPIKFYTWKKENLKILSARGNDNSNEFFASKKLFERIEAENPYDFIVREKYIKQTAIQSLTFPENLAEDSYDVEKFLEEEFRKSISKENYNQVLNFLVWGLDPNQSINGTPVLHKTCYKGKSALIELLICYGANPLLKDMQMKTPLFYLYARNIEALANQMKEYQIYYEGIQKGVDFTKPPSYFTLKRLTGMSDEDFAVLLFDTMQEIDRRTHKLPGEDKNDDIALRKLASLSDINLRDLADTVFDELNIREFRRLHEAVFSQKRSRVDLALEIGYGWLENLKVSQVSEKNDAMAEREYIVRRMNELERLETNRDSMNVKQQQTLKLDTSSSPSSSSLNEKKKIPNNFATPNSYKETSRSVDPASSTSSPGSGSNIKKALFEVGQEMKQKLPSSKSPVRQSSLPQMKTQYRGPEDISEELTPEIINKLRLDDDDDIPLSQKQQFQSKSSNGSIKVDVKPSKPSTESLNSEVILNSARDSHMGADKLEDLSLSISNSVAALISKTKSLIHSSKEQRLSECMVLSSDVIKSFNEVIKLWRDLLAVYPNNDNKSSLDNIGSELIMTGQAFVKCSKETPKGSNSSESQYYENIRNCSVNLLKKTKPLIEFITEEQKKEF